jgi:hypothetical protein
MRQTQKLKDLHAKFVRELDAVWEDERPERQLSLEDRRFPVVAGAMWEGEFGEQFENKPKIEVNKLLLACTRIENEYKQNRIDVDFVSKDGAKNPAMADKCDSVYRADRQDSASKEAADNAFIEMLYGGMGAARLTTCYEDESDEENERQRIVFKPIYDADQCVFFSKDGKLRDKSDASRSYVLTPMTHDAFKDEWDKDPISMEIERTTFDWRTTDAIYVAEAYEVEKVSKLVEMWEHPVSKEERKVYEEEYEDDPELRQTLEDTGWQMVKSRRIKERKLHKYILDGQEILEDCGYIAGTEHPIIPAYARRWVIEGIERYQGHVRTAKDPMRLKNAQLSALAFTAATSPIEAPIFLAEQIAGHEDRWENAHIENPTFLTINALRNDQGALEAAGPLSYTKPPSLSPAMAALLQLTETDLAEILGKPNEGEKMEANQSGKAVELVQKQIGMLAAVYFEAMRVFYERAGKVWLSMAKDVYVEKGRKLKAISKEGAAEQVELQKPVMIDGKAAVENDFSRVDLDVVATTGPSSESKKAASVRAKTSIALITSDEETKKVVTLSALRDIEDEGTSDVSEWARRRLVGMGVIEPTEEDKKRIAEEQQGQKPDPNAEFLMAEADKSRALTKKAGADTVLTLQKAAESQANTMKTLQEVDMTDANAALSQMNPPAVGEQGPAPMNAEQGNMNDPQPTAPPAQF